MNSLGSSSRGRVGGATLAALAALTLAIALALASTSTAQASGSCPGVLIAQQPVEWGLGSLDVYYDGATGRNCARVVSSSSTWGVRKHMQVVLLSCSSTSPSQPCGSYRRVQDQGSFRYYAGPVSVSARGRCILAYGKITTSTSHGNAQLGRWASRTTTPLSGVHCG